MRIKNMFLGTYNLENEYLVAGDVDGSGIIDSTDYMRIKGHFLGNFNIHDAENADAPVKEYETLDTSILRNDFYVDEFLIGSWVSFYSFDKDSYQTQLDKMNELGINFNFFPKQFGQVMDAQTIAAVEAEYAKRNMYYMMYNANNSSLVNQHVAIAKDMEHCIGYHIVDEPGVGALQSVAEVLQAFRNADSTRYPFANLYPGYVGPAAVGESYYDYVNNFVKFVKPENLEYLSHDFYGLNELSTNYSIFTDMETHRKIALENGGLRTHAFTQSCAWTGKRMPTIDDMRWNVYGYLAYGYKGLSWFNLVCPGSSDTDGEGFRDAIIYRDGTIRNQQLYNDFAALNKEMAVLGDTLINLECLHAYHSRAGIDGVEILPKDWMLVPDEDDDIIISHMADRNNGDTYVMIFNKQIKAQDATINVDYKNVESMSYLNPFTGEWENVDMESGTFDVSLRAGEGKLYRVNMAK
jgi:hypothetical protein